MTIFVTAPLYCDITAILSRYRILAEKLPQGIFLIGDPSTSRKAMNRRQQISFFPTIWAQRNSLFLQLVLASLKGARTTLTILYINK